MNIQNRLDGQQKFGQRQALLLTEGSIRAGVCGREDIACNSKVRIKTLCDDINLHSSRVFD